MLVTKAKRPRGTGRIYHQAGSKNWWVQFYQNGLCHRESTGTSNRREAEAYLRTKLGEIEKGTFIPKATKVTVKEVLDAKLENLKMHQKKDLINPANICKLHLEPYFGHMKALDLSRNRRMLTPYILKRQAEGAKGGTINRELSLLRASLYLAHGDGILPTLPYRFPKLKESFPRQRFLNAEEFGRMADACAHEGLYLLGMLLVGGLFGWRKTAVRTLTVGAIDWTENSVSLAGERSKSGEPVKAQMPTLLREVLARCFTGKDPADPLFTYTDGTPVLDYRRAWHRARKAAGLPDVNVHDLCRTAIRNMDRDHTPREVAKGVSGKKTNDMYTRYRIFDDEDLSDAARRMDERKEQLKHSLSIVQPVEEVAEGVVLDNPQDKVTMNQ